MDVIRAEQTKAVTGSQDNSVKVWDMGAGDLYSINTYRFAHSRAVTGLSSSPTTPDVFASCSRDRCLNIWDRRLSTPIVAFNESHNVGFTTVYWSDKLEQSDEVLFVGDEAGWIHGVDARNPKEFVSSWKVFDAPIHRLRFNGSNAIVLADSAEVKVLDVSADGLVGYTNNDSDDYVRDAHWTSSNEFRTIGWDSKVRKHIVKALTNN